MTMRTIILALILTASGCSTMKPLDNSTPVNDNSGKNIELFKLDGVSVYADSKTGGMYNHDNQQSWDIIVNNSNDIDMCVVIVWSLVDFNFTSSYQNPFIVKKNSSILLGVMFQTHWILDGVDLPPESYGRIYYMTTYKPRHHDQCIDIST